MELDTNLFKIGQYINTGEMECEDSYDIRCNGFIRAASAFSLFHTVIAPYWWISDLFSYERNIASPSWGIYHEINHGYVKPNRVPFAFLVITK